MKLAFVYLPGRIERLPDSGTNGRGYPLPRHLKYRPTDFFYGAFELRDRGHSVGVFEVREQPRRSILRFAADKLLTLKYLPVKTYPAIVDAVWFLLEDLKHYDVVVATTPGIAFSLAIWQRLGLFRRPIVAIQCGILNYGFHPLRIHATRFLLRNMSSQLYGIGELESIKRIYGIEANSVEVNCFGVDTEFWTPVPERPDDGTILAVGNDASRDFATLVRAAEQMKHRVVIVTKRPLPDPLPGNVTHFKGTWKTRELDDNEIRELIRSAMAVAIPLTPTLQPSGQSVALQAMACGKPVLLTKTQGLWERIQLEDMKNLVFVSPCDPDDWVSKIHLLHENTELRRKIGDAARQYAEKYGNIHQFATRLERLCRKTIRNTG